MKKIFRVLMALCAAALIVFGVAWAREFLRVDRCYDAGGAIAADGKCIGAQPWGMQ